MRDPNHIYHSNQEIILNQGWVLLTKASKQPSVLVLQKQTQQDDFIYVILKSVSCKSEEKMSMISVSHKW